MKTKGIVLSLMASTLVNLPVGLAKELIHSTMINRAQGTTIELYPVKYSNSNGGGHLTYKGKSLYTITKKPVAVFENFKYQNLSRNKLGIKLILSKKEGRELERVTRKYLNTKLAIVHNGKVIMVPLLKSVLGGEAIELSFNSHEKFETVLKSFKGE